MNDFIKELNITDFLGISVPGCILLLLVLGDKTSVVLWSSFFGISENSFLQGLIFIVLGYLVGMLIQEIGDLIEKGLWCCSAFDPKTYAAYAVGPEKIREGLSSNDFSAAPLKGNGIKTAFSVFSMLIILYGTVIGFGRALKEACLVVIPGLDDSSFMFLYLDGSLSVAICAVAIFLIYALTSRIPDKGVADKIDAVRTSNAYIQTIIVNSVNSSKRTLYDGFRFVMRNLLIVLAIANYISFWMPLDYYKLAAQYMMTNSAPLQHKFFFVEVIYTFSIVLMYIRYYHYAYLRYKYSYEDFVLLHQNTQKKTQSVSKQNM